MCKCYFKISFANSNSFPHFFYCFLICKCYVELAFYICNAILKQHLLSRILLIVIQSSLSPSPSPSFYRRHLLYHGQHQLFFKNRESCLISSSISHNRPSSNPPQTAIVAAVDVHYKLSSSSTTPADHLPRFCRRPSAYHVVFCFCPFIKKKPKFFLQPKFSRLGPSFKKMLIVFPPTYFPLVEN